MTQTGKRCTNDDAAAVEVRDYQCRYCRFIGALQDALDHFEATDHDCDEVTR